MNIQTQIRERLVEAAKIERRLPATGTRPDQCKGYWPLRKHSQDDMNSWGKERIAEHLSDVMKALARQCAPNEVSRFEECMGWVMHLVHRTEQRQAIHAWAHALAGGRPFRHWCRRNGLHQKTAQRRVDAGIRSIEVQLAKKGHSLVETGDFGVSSEAQIFGSDLGTLDEVRRTPQSWMAPGAKPTHTRADEAAQQRDKDIAAANERSRRRREKLGLLEAA